jgi:ABC-type bacteriocin/lantibiotic exporter with double-glycine peptidase domain
VLVLDESMSALDVPTRNTLLSNILRHFRDRIVIVVTHDPAVIAAMQHVLFLQPHVSLTDSSHDPHNLDKDTAALAANWAESVADSAGR